MKFEELLISLGERPYFDLAMLVQLSGDTRQTLRTQLYRWVKAGKLLSLRRGMYAFAEPYRRQPINPAALSNYLYKPSYISAHWALGYYGLIPEKVTVLTGVTTRVPRQFANAFGVFRYFNVRPALFFGYRPVTMNRQKVLVAEPEKALLDLWHLERGKWDEDRTKEMRYQNFEVVDEHRLVAYADRYDSLRLNRAVEQWKAFAKRQEGTIEL